MDQLYVNSPMRARLHQKLETPYGQFKATMKEKRQTLKAEFNGYHYSTVVCILLLVIKQADLQQTWSLQQGA